MAALSSARLSNIPRSIWVLGCVSMLMDMSSELIHSLLPVFLVSVMGASAMTVGLIEGVAESIALIVKVFSGTLSDYLGRRKMLAVLGYGLSAMSKPLFAFSASIGMVFTARFIDRMGKGIRGAPRDALVADVVEPGMRGAAYGLRQALDTLGAFCGPLLAIALMLLWSGDIRAVFRVSILPAVLAVLMLYFGVCEPARQARAQPINPVHWDELKRLSGAYWWVVAIGAILTLARFSEAFLVLLARRNGLPLAWAPLVFVGMNITYAVAAYPFGKLSDRMSHSRLLVGGLLVLILADLVLATAQSWLMVMFGVALWGLHLGITQGLLSTMIAAIAPDHFRGTAFGYFNLLSGIAMLLSSTLAGLLWDSFGPACTFFTGAGFCTLALLAIVCREIRAK